MPNRRRPALLWIVIVLLAFIAAMAIPVGWQMVRTPHVDVIGIPIAWIEDTVLGSWLVPGLLLFGLLGLGSLCAIYGLLAPPNWAWPQQFNPFHSQHWAWTFALGIGAALMVWIAVQLLTIRHWFWLQPVIFVIGLAVVLILCLPDVRQFYTHGAAHQSTPRAAE